MTNENNNQAKPTNAWERPLAVDIEPRPTVRPQIRMEVSEDGEFVTIHLMGVLNEVPTLVSELVLGWSNFAQLYESAREAASRSRERRAKRVLDLVALAEVAQATPAPAPPAAGATPKPAA